METIQKKTSIAQLNASKKWREKNLDRVKIYQDNYNKEYYHQHKEDIKQVNKNYYELHQEEILKQKKEYYRKKKEHNNNN